MTPSVCSHERNSEDNVIERDFKVHFRNKGAHTCTWQACNAATNRRDGGGSGEQAVSDGGDAVMGGRKGKGGG